MKKLFYCFLALSCFWMGSSHAKSVANEQTCRAMAYVEPGSAVEIRNKALLNAPAVARLHERQYLCVINQSDVEGWAKVKAVPFANGKNTLCKANEQNASCNEMANFKVAWFIKEPLGSACKLRTHHDSAGNIVTKASGSCATGWLQNQYIHYFAD